MTSSLLFYSFFTSSFADFASTSSTLGAAATAAVTQVQAATKTINGKLRVCLVFASSLLDQA